MIETFWKWTHLAACAICTIEVLFIHPLEEAGITFGFLAILSFQLFRYYDDKINKK